jgi:hypothetical protein
MFYKTRDLLGSWIPHNMPDEPVSPKQNRRSDQDKITLTNLITTVVEPARFANLLQTKCQPISSLQTQLWIFSTNQDSKQSIAYSDLDIQHQSSMRRNNLL